MNAMTYAWGVIAVWLAGCGGPPSPNDPVEVGALPACSYAPRPSGPSHQGLREKSPSYVGQDLRNANFYGASLNTPDFTGANLTGASFYGATLDHPIFTQAILTCVNFRGATLNAPTLVGARLIGACADGSTWNEPNLENTNLLNANFYGATVGDGNFTGAVAEGMKCFGWNPGRSRNKPACDAAADVRCGQ